MAVAPGQCWRAAQGGITVNVRLTPKSARDEIEGAGSFGGETVLRARVRAVPDKGKANAALKKLVARWLGVPPSTVTLAGGSRSRLKSVAVAGETGELAARIAARLEPYGE